MKLSAPDILNIGVAVFTIASMMTGMLSTFYSVVVVILVVVWFSYTRLPWAHRKWKTEGIGESVREFYTYSRILHAVIIYSLVVLIATSLLVGFSIKSGPKLLASRTAECVWNNTSWGTNVIQSSNVPQEFKPSKKEDQPYAVIIDQNMLRAVPLQQTLAIIATNYSDTYDQIGGVLFLFICVIGMVLFPTEILAEARSNKDEAKA